MNISTKNIYIISIALILVIAGAFYGGMKYSESKVPNGVSGARNPGNFSQVGRQQGFQGMRNGQSGANFINGDIIANNGNTITVKLRDGGSKIVFLSDSTQITKSTDGTRDDLVVDKSVMINGQQNSDGSVTAQMIQIRPQMPIQNPPVTDSKQQQTQQ
jgi:hypothetical protein